ncbi:Putative Flp pilus-assembly TadE/G-like [Altererythrobacter xiamenensis]|uniref:Putative Flp pilus-assembly TadE/G-like n=1 Tax=Altererythrobacter xiamenensis TaxID=1316679 RepID=A0A1Y6EFD0_9SPHN|nr:Tad domain-containing protein [Altererythrobacter xiamenensis]SMQ58863.1 Putative Flp pilus-assembly TadE/G-like [Altererythrobacter xiamenensis]
MLKSLKALGKKLGGDRRGNVLIVSALGAASLVGAAGLGVDTAQWYLAKRQLQQATDSGALAAAMNLYRSAAFVDAAENEVDRNFPDAVNVERVVNPPQEGDYIGDNGAIEVVANVNRRLPFSSIFMSSASTIRTRSVATIVGDGEHCVISLAPDGTGVDVQGNANVILGCGVAANSPSGISVDLSGSSYLSATPISSVGGIDYSSNNIAPNTTLQAYGLPVDDPLADRNLETPTSPANCTYRNVSVNSNTTQTLYPGRYCGGLAIRGRAELEPGVYIIDGGTFSANAQAEIIGEGVTFILTGNNTATVADLQFNGGAELDLRAPTPDEDPVWHGILFYQDEMGSDTESIINGGSDMNFEGIVYMPNGDVRFNGNAGQHADCLLLIANRVNFAGESSLDNDCPSHIDDVDTTAKIIRVVE